MISITKLYCDETSEGDRLRYGDPNAKDRSGHVANYALPKTAAERRPIVVWNITQTCNLACRHCYSNSERTAYEGELSTDEAKAVIEDLADFRVPAILFSGGEPLVRKDLFELARYAKSLGLRMTLSTNGTLITRETAEAIKAIGFSYVGISFDGIGKVNDQFRGMDGAFDQSLAGLRHCLAVGQKVGLRMTLTRHNVEDLNNIFDFVEREGIARICFYHLVYSGRGGQLSQDDLSHTEARAAMDIILDRSRKLPGVEVLTVDNHVDGPYLYLKLLQKDRQKAKRAKEKLLWNGGGRYSSGVGLADIDFQGNVHPDQFWMHYTLGNVRERKFSEIWQDESEPLLSGLRDRLPRLKGRCSTCRFVEMCGGALRVRADLTEGDPWAPDPACYLTDAEIGAFSPREPKVEQR